MPQQARNQVIVRKQMAVSIHGLMETRFIMAGCQLYVVLRPCSCSPYVRALLLQYAS